MIHLYFPFSYCQRIEIRETLSQQNTVLNHVPHQKKRAPSLTRMKNDFYALSQVNQMSLSIVNFGRYNVISNCSACTHDAPYSYDDFDDDAKLVLKNVADMLSAHYNKQYDVTTAHGIEDDGCSEWVYIGLNEPDGTETFFIMHGFDYEAVSCSEYYARMNGEIENLVYARMR